MAAQLAVSKWHGLDVTHNLSPYIEAPDSFHRLHMGRLSIVAFLFRRLDLDSVLILEHRPQFNTSALEVYDIIEEAGLECVGHLFRSPMRVKCDHYYASFQRRGVNPIEDIIKTPVGAAKRFTLSDKLLMFTHSAGLMITRLEANSVTTMLGQ